MRPELVTRNEGGRRWPVLVWRFADAHRVASTAPLGGGLGERAWVLNATVDPDYGRLDPWDHVAELAAGLGLTGAGTGLLTALDVAAFDHVVDGPVAASATVGLTHPVWAAAPPAVASAGVAGTINIVAVLDEPLGDGALCNALTTATEAKVQALGEAGVPATGTPSDAVCVACPSAGSPGAFGGPRSELGSALARAVHGAVLAGCGRWAGSR